MSDRRHEHYEILLVKAVDGLLSDAEQRALDEHLGSCPTCTEELADFRRIKQTTDAMTSRILQDAAIEPPRPRGGGRALLTASYLLLLLGALTLLAFAAYSFAFAHDVPLVVKLGAGILGAGLAGLVAYALPIRLRALSRDPYEEIDR